MARPPRTPAPPHAAQPMLRPWSALALVAVAACLAYLPALRGDFLWDDEAHVTRPELRSLAGLGRIWSDFHATQQFYPLLHSAFWIQAQLWGDNTLGYHLVNLLLHITAACLVYAVLRRLEVPGALLAAAIFALHPVHVETAAWITEQKNTLSAVFYLSAAWCYLRFDSSRGLSWYALALVLFAAALASKTVTATLPAALLVVFWWRRGRSSSAASPIDPPRLSWRRDVLPLVPFFVLGIAAGLLTAVVERKLLGAEGESFFELTIVQRVLLAGRVVWFYLAKLVWPAELVFIYPRWDVDASQGWQWLFPIATVAVTVLFWRCRHRWRGPLAAWLYFVGTLFPALGFFNVVPFRYSFVADHFQYLASLGPIALFSALIARGLARLSPPRQRIGELACVLLLGVLAVLTSRQSRMYTDPETLYRQIIAQDPQSWFGYNNLGSTLLNLGRAPAAVELLTEALRLKPGLHQAEYNLATALFNTGRVNEAIERLTQLVERKPDYADARFNLGTALVAVGRPQEAVPHFERLVQLRPADAEAWGNLALANAKSARRADAITAGEKAVALAKAQQNTALAEQIDAWLNSYRRNPSDLTTTPGASIPPSQAPATPPSP